jgi:predicted ribosome quality control (RQC) complex YloA/Tae2 family protein
VPSRIRALSSKELGAIAKELGVLASSYFKNFYELSEGAFLITFSKERKEIAVYVNLARTINLTEFKEKSDAPTEFVLALRKKLDGSRVESVEQHKSDRILIISLSGKAEGRLIIEMFDKGNLLFVNRENLIELVYRGRSFKERSLRKSMIYVFPQQRGKAGAVHDLEGAEEPRAYEKEGAYVDFAMAPVPEYEQDPAVSVRKFETMSALLDSLYLNERSSKVSPEKIREIEELQKSIEKLRKQVEETRSSSEEYKKVANRIFERMKEINELLAHASKSKVKSADELKGFGNINVKRVDAKRKTITVELD